MYIYLFRRLYKWYSLYACLQIISQKIDIVSSTTHSEYLEMIADRSDEYFTMSAAITVGKH